MAKENIQWTKSLDESHKMYEAYFNQHKANIHKAWEQIQVGMAEEPFITDKYLNWYINDAIDHHDESKKSEYEWNQYRRYFYPVYGIDIDRAFIQKEYDEAWKHHYTHNKHHWEYWANRDTNAERETLPFIRQCAFVEMACDWQAMSLYYKNNIRDWYEENLDSIVMTPEDTVFIKRLVYYLGELPSDMF